MAATPRNVQAPDNSVHADAVVEVKETISEFLVTGSLGAGEFEVGDIPIPQNPVLEGSQVVTAFFDYTDKKAWFAMGYWNASGMYHHHRYTNGAADLGIANVFWHFTLMK